MSAGDFHCALLASAYQAINGVCASGCFVQKARSVDIAMIRMLHYDTNLVSWKNSETPRGPLGSKLKLSVRTWQAAGSTQRSGITQVK
jgi:hypothetical protein